MSGKYNITDILLRIEEKARETGYYSRYAKGFARESDELRLRTNDVTIGIRDYDDPKVVKPLYVHIVYNGYDYIGMYKESELSEMLDKLWTYPKGYIKANFEK